MATFEMDLRDSEGTPVECCIHRFKRTKWHWEKVPSKEDALP